MSKYKTYRMYRGTMVRNSVYSGFGGKEFTPTARTFKGRTISEATKKMDKFIRYAQITGSFFLKVIH